MNCKPGDLARMVYAERKSAIGLMVEVLNIDRPDPVRGPSWNCKAISGARSDIGYCMPGELCYIPDAWLRPIRDPGEDASDESLAWLPPVPNTTKETA